MEAEDVLDLRQHILVHLMRQVSDGQQEILDLHVRGLATQDDIRSGSSHVFLVNALILVVNSVHCLFYLKWQRNVCGIPRVFANQPKLP